MLKVAKTQKVKQSGFGEDTTDWIRDGRLFILMTKKLIEPREWTKTLVCKSIDHSSCNQECQWEELLTPTAAMSHCTTWTDELLLNNSTLTKSQRQSNQTNGNICLSQWLEITLELFQLTPDGSNFSDINHLMLSTKEERWWMFKEDMIEMVKTSLCTRNMEDSTNNGILSMLMKCQQNQRNVKWTKTLASKLIATSTLFLRWTQEDILTELEMMLS